MIDSFLFRADHIIDARYFFFFDIRFGNSFDDYQSSIFFGSDKGNSSSLFPSPSCPSDSMSITFRVLRDSIIDHMSEVLDVNTSRSYIGRHQDSNLFQLKLFQDSFSLLLGDIAMQCIGRITPRSQTLSQPFTIHFGPTKDNAIKITYIIQYPRKCFQFIFGLYFKIQLLRIDGSHLLRSGADDFVFIHIIFCDMQYLSRHSSRKHQHSLFLFACLEYFFYIIQKSHIEHFISFVQDKKIKLIKFQCSSFQMINHSPRSSYDDIYTTFEISDLWSDMCTTIDRDDFEFFSSTIGTNFFSDLDRQLPRWCQDYCLDIVFASIKFFNQRNTKCCGLSSPCLSLSHDINRSCEQKGNTFCLDCTGFFKSLLDQRLKNIL